MRILQISYKFQEKNMKLHKKGNLNIGGGSAVSNTYMVYVVMIMKTLNLIIFYQDNGAKKDRLRK